MTENSLLELVEPLVSLVTPVISPVVDAGPVVGDSLVVAPVVDAAELEGLSVSESLPAGS